MVRSLITFLDSASKVVDALERLTHSNADVPPYSMRRLIGSPPLDFSANEFREEGRRFKRHLEEAGALRSGMTVGEIGCGCGRMAVPILDSYDVTYYGFDIVPSLITWLTEHVSRVHREAKFHFLDIWNSRYNPSGSLSPDEAIFPFPEAGCDLLYASSVFTHILTKTTERYFSEVRRTLKPGGRAVITAFLLDIDHPEKADSGKAAAGVDARIGGTPEFIHRDSGCAYYVYADVPELMVGYNLSDLQKLASEAGLQIKLHSAGSWKNGGASKSWQDIAVLTHASP